MSKQLPYDLHDTIVGLATGRSSAAVAMFRVSGKDAIRRVSALCGKPQRLLAASANTVHRHILQRRFEDGATELLDDVMVAVFKAPASYTGEDVVEIYCHGGLATIDALNSAFLELGLRQAEPGEFTYRAFMHGKMDLTRAEAVRELVESRTATARSLSLSRLAGSVERAIRDLAGQVKTLVARCAIQLDYPDDEVPDLTGDAVLCEELAKTARARAATWNHARLFQEGAVAVLAGRTNAGKSSLFNTLLQEERAIVSEEHGTTRDFLEGWLDVQGVPVRLFDTAGLRVTAEGIENEGIRRTRRLMEGADLILYVVDATAGVGDEDRAALAGLEHCIPVASKTDLPGAKVEDGWIAVSAHTGLGVSELNQAILSRLGMKSGALSPDAGSIDSLRQKQLLEKAAAALEEARDALREKRPLDMVAFDLGQAMDALGRITGEVYPEDILETMFSRFCVGK